MSASLLLRRTATMAAACAAALAAVAPAAASAANQAVTLTSSRSFSPATVSIQPGDTVTWQWSGAKHNVTADAGQADTFASGDKSTGTYVHQFVATGRYTYRCTLHSGMTGVVVVATAGPTPDTTPPSAPVGATASAADARVTLDWADVGAADLANYVVERRVGTGAWTIVGSPIASVLVDTTVTNGTGYSYRVKAVDTAGNASAVSAVVSATPVAPPPAPPAPPPSSGPVTRRVAIADYAFSPAVLTINRGDTVVWDWAGADLNHSVTSVGGLLDSFDSHLGVLLGAILGPPPGGYRRTFNEVGSFTYVCRVHPDMVGTVVVVASGAPDTPPASPAAAPAAEAPTSTAVAARTAKRYDVLIADMAFTPPKLSVALGDVVTWRWSGKDVNHSVTSRPGSAQSLESHPGRKISEITRAPAGGTYAQTMSREGTITYFCRVHPGMTGSITVGPARVRVRGARARRTGGSLRLSYRLTAAASVRAKVYRGSRRVATRSAAGRKGANVLRIALPRSARRSALRVVLRAGGAGGPQARMTVKARRASARRG